MQADRCSIFMLDVKNKEVWSKVAIGEKATIRFPMDQGIAGDTIASGKSLIIPDAYTYPNFNAEIDKETGYKSKNIVTAPMRNADGVVIGCFEVINKLQGSFTEEDASFLQLLANHASAAIEGALLHRDLTETHTKLVLRRAAGIHFAIDHILAETIDLGCSEKSFKLNEFWAGYLATVYQSSDRLLFIC